MNRGNTVIYTCWLIGLLCTFHNLSYAQCFPDRHNTNLDAGWISCNPTLNPNPDRPNGYWLLFELEERQAINSVKIWNSNHPEFTDSGVKTLEIDYLNENEQWVTFSTHTIPRAEASGFYEGVELDLPGEFVSTKILFNLTENYGGTCRGLSEVRIGLIDKITSTEDLTEDRFMMEVSPNPFNDRTRISVYKIDGDKLKYELVNHLGQIIYSQELDTRGGSVSFDISGASLAPGAYYLNIFDGLVSSSKKLFVIH